MDLRVAAYAVITEERGILLAHWAEDGHSGWTLPGGGLEPGEDPADAAVREVMEETGYAVELDGLVGVDSVVVPPERRLHGASGPMQALRVLYRAHVVGGALRDEVGGTTDTAAWFGLAEVDGLDRVSVVDVGRRCAGLL